MLIAAVQNNVSFHDVNPVHKNIPNPLPEVKKNKLTKKLISYLLKTAKLILKGDWNKPSSRLNSKMLKPMKNFVNK